MPFPCADVDGTLIRSVGEDSNVVHKDAFKHAFLEVFGLDTHIDKLQHHGGTDPLILVKVLQVIHDIPKEKCMERLEDMKKAMNNYFAANQSRCDAELL
jgi:phosphoglycolate phosphatase